MSIRVARKRPNAYQHGDLRHALIQPAAVRAVTDGLGRMLHRGIGT